MGPGTSLRRYWPLPAVAAFIALPLCETFPLRLGRPLSIRSAAAFECQHAFATCRRPQGLGSLEASRATAALAGRCGGRSGRRYLAVRLLRQAAPTAHDHAAEFGILEGSCLSPSFALVVVAFCPIPCVSHLSMSACVAFNEVVSLCLRYPAHHLSECPNMLPPAYLLGKGGLNVVKWGDTRPQKKLLDSRRLSQMMSSGRCSHAVVTDGRLNAQESPASLVCLSGDTCNVFQHPVDTSPATQQRRASSFGE